MPRDAEAWLAERGIRRDPIRVEPMAPPAPDGPSPSGQPSDQAAGAPVGDQPRESADDPAPTDAGVADGPDLSARDAQRLLAQAEADAQLRDADQRATPQPAGKTLEDGVAEAVAFVRRSTSMTPQSEGRLRDKLGERGYAGPVITQALERARRERLVDDAAMAAALVDERRRKGHAPAKIRRDLRERGFDDATLDAALGNADGQDLEAAAYAVAAEKAARTTGVEAEAAYRRVAAFVARRGYPEGLARKVAREAVFTARDEQRAAGH